MFLVEIIFFIEKYNIYSTFKNLPEGKKGKLVMEAG